MSAGSAAHDSADVVSTHAEAKRQARPPLIVLEPLAAFLHETGIGDGAVEVRTIGDGHSNATYAVRRGERQVVLRRPPRPPFAPSAHDMVREARTLLRLRRAGVRVPEVLAVCEHDRVIGAPFYVMEHLDGEVISTAVPRWLQPAAARQRVGLETVDALGELHSLDPADAGLADFARPTGYLERQLKRFASVWAAQRTRELPELDRVTRWLGEHLPASPPTRVVHGDYRLGNLMFAA